MCPLRVQISDEGALALAQALSSGSDTLPVLARISMNDSNFTDVGAKAIAKAVLSDSAPPHLRAISLRGNAFTQQGKDALESACKKKSIKLSL